LTDTINVTIGTDTINATLGTAVINVTIGDDTINATVADNAVTATIGTDAINVTFDGTFSVSFINAGKKFFLNGNNGNTYLIYNTTLNRLELFVNGAIKRAWN